MAALWGVGASTDPVREVWPGVGIRRDVPDGDDELGFPGLRGAFWDGDLSGAMANPLVEFPK